MDRNDQQAIEDLFRKLETVERQATPRDSEADAFIRERIAQQPGAPYYMAQTIVVQEQALAAAQARIEALEQQTAQNASQGSSGGLFGSLFGGGRRPSGAVPRVGGTPSPHQSPLAAAQHRGGGGFLAGAAQTAMGVAGGVLLGNAIAGMFGGNEAQAAEPAPAQEEPAADEPQADQAGFDDGGGFDDMEF